MLNIGEVIIVSLILSFVFYLIIQRIDFRRIQRKVQKLYLQMELVNDVHRTLLWGLYERFRLNKNQKEVIEDDGKSYIITLKSDGQEVKTENPHDFERFVARVLEANYGGEAIVTKGSGDYGVDIEHYRPDGLFLIQVKHYEPTSKLSYVPIALIHSQMVKQSAKGGMVITTCRFSEPAKKYDHVQLGIELFEGSDFVEMWSKVMYNTKTTLLPVINEEPSN